MDMLAVIVSFLFLFSVNGDEEAKSCENRGIWLENKGLFGCFCRDNFWGAWCQFSCNNGDLRQYESGEFFCECADGFGGAYCERRLQEGEKTTAELECQNDGVFRASSGECRCPAPYFGAHCQFSCGNGKMKIWKSTMKVQGVIDRVWDTLFGPDQREDKDEPLIDPSLLGAVAADNFLNYFHANTAKYYCECRPGFFGLNCEYSTEQPRIPTITMRPGSIQSQYGGRKFVSVDESISRGNDEVTLNAKLGIGFSIILVLGMVAFGVSFWYCKKRDDVIVRYVSSPRPKVESPRLQKSDIVKIAPPPAYQYEDHSEMEKKYANEKFAL